MKKIKIVVLIKLLAILTIGCSSGKDLKYIEQNKSEVEKLYSIGSNLIKYELALKEHEEDIEVFTSIEYYEKGKHVDTINLIGGGVSPETPKENISLGVTTIDEKTINLTMFQGGAASSSEIKLPYESYRLVSKFMDDIPKLNGNQDYYLGILMIDENVGEYYPVNFHQEDVMTLIVEHDYVYVYKLRIEDSH